MQADTYQLKTILTPERRYVIPTFQRDYEWTRGGQWQLLFEDLDNVADRLGEARAQAEANGTSKAKAEKGVTPHFLGAIVCDQLPSSAGGLDLRAVIDGQQRITTLQLLVRGALDVLIEKDSSRIRQVRRLLENPHDVIVHAHEKHKLWPRRKDRDVWPVAMADDSLPAPAPGEHLYLQARRFFATSFKEGATAVDGSDRTDDLVDALLDLFKLVVIDLEDNDDAQVIFEVLNGRQTPLSASDLVKNLLFLRGELGDEAELEKLYDTYWAEFDEEWWKATVGTGHAARGRRDVLLSVWLTAASGFEASVAHLYGQVRNYLALGDIKTEQILIELHTYGQAYKAIYGASPAGSDVLKVVYARLDKLKILTAVPLLAWLRTLPESQLATDDHERAALAVESWVVRRMILGANTRGYGTAFLQLLKRAQEAAVMGENVADAIEAGLVSSPNSLGWPTDVAVVGAFAADKFYDRFTQERIRLVLGAIDEQLRKENPKTEPAVFAYDALQIEHVMPRAWRDHWPLPDDADDAASELAERARDQVVHRIGNLTLVTSTFNQSVSNSAWTVKQPELSSQSALQLNGPIAISQAWHEATIAARGLELAKVACRVWLAPPAVEFSDAPTTDPPPGRPGDKVTFIEAVAERLSPLIADGGLTRGPTAVARHGVALYVLPKSHFLTKTATARVVASANRTNVGLYFESHPTGAGNWAAAEALRLAYESRIDDYGLTIDDWHASGETIKRDRIITRLSIGYDSGEPEHLANDAAQVLQGWMQMFAENPLSDFDQAVRDVLAND